MGALMDCHRLSLYDRLGGEPALAAAVSKLYERVLADPTLKPFFAGADVDLVKAHQFEFLRHAMGGPGQTGDSLRQSHSHLCIEKRHFWAVADHMIEALSELGIDDDVAAEVMSLLEPLSKQIVNTLAPSARGVNNSERGRNVSNCKRLFSQAAEIAFLSLLFAGAAGAQEAWQIDYVRFLDEVAPFLMRQPSLQVTAELEAKFVGKPITWVGVFESLAIHASSGKPLAHIRVPVRSLRVYDGHFYETVPTLEFWPEPPNVADWERRRSGDSVKFRTTLIQPVFKALDGIRFVNFFFRDLQWINPALPPAEVLPAIAPAGVTNGASLAPGIAPASWITILGTNLSTATRTWTNTDFNGSQLPRALDGVAVKVNGKDALVYYVSPTQINALAPDDNAVGPVSISVSNAQGTSAAVIATLNRYAPAWFLFDPDGRKYAAAVHPDGVLVGRAGLFGATVASRPAKPGDRILIFGTGFGPTDPPVSADRLVAGTPALAEGQRLAVRIGSVPVTVEFAGLTSSGLYQFNIVVPNVAQGDQPLAAEINGAGTPANVFVTVAP